MIVITNSADPTAQRMAKGVGDLKPCQWQELYFIGHAVVRVDQVIPAHEMVNIDWLKVSNDLTRLFYRVAGYQKLVRIETALDHTKKLSGNWKTAKFIVNSNDLYVAYRKITGADHYQVSFVRFTKWKFRYKLTNNIAKYVTNFFNK